MAWIRKICGGNGPYTPLRDDIWPFSAIWGDKKDAVIIYLKTIYMDQNQTHVVDRTEGNYEHEAEIILDWWWKKRYGQEDTKEISSYPEEFGKYLLDKYTETKLDPIDNRPPSPRS